MSAAISGIGLVTPQGADLGVIWAALQSGESPAPSLLSSPLSTRTFPYLAIPRETIRAMERHPRLRRSSEISHFSVLAGLNALADAGIDPKSTTSRIGVVFAISSGGVRYTTRFYAEITRQGAGAASPLLFPETVYNAPASHLAALLGIDGNSYTVVGDSSVGMQALAMAANLLALDELDHCVVVGCEEADWIICEAFRSWRYFTPADRLEAFGGRGKRATVFSEGAGAVVLSREGFALVEKIEDGTPFWRSEDAAAAAEQTLRDLGPIPDAVVSGANGTALDDAEKKSLEEVWPGIPIWPVKNQIGESIGASVLQQFALASLALRHNQLPNVNGGLNRIGITSLGYNFQSSGAMLQRC